MSKEKELKEKGTRKDQGSSQTTVVSDQTGSYRTSEDPTQDGDPRYRGKSKKPS